VRGPVPLATWWNDRSEVAFGITAAAGGSGALDLDRSTTTFRIFQEILTNVARHAHASRVDVKFEITDAQMTKVDDRFMIATEERPFVNYDAKYRFKFDSGTIQNDAIRLKGKVVRIKKYGWRVPILSWYENIVKIEEVQQR